MRILEIIGSVDPRQGGVIEGVLRQSDLRARRGLQTQIVSLDCPHAPWVRDCPVKAFGLGPCRPDFRGSPWQRYGYTPQLVPWLRKHATDYDMVVVNGLWNYASLASRRVLPRSAVPYIVFPHGMLDPWFRVGRPLKHIAKQMHWWISEGPLLANAGAVLFTSEDEMTRAMNAFRPYDVRGRVVGYGTADLEGDCTSQRAAFRCAVSALADRPFLLFLGRIDRKKGCDILVEAFARIASAHPELDLVVAGPDPLGLRATIEATALAAGMAARIHWPGMLSGDVKWGALRDCAALVLPSHQENFGVVVAEALAAGRPVLISDQVNIWREVKAAGAGMISTADVDGTSRMLRDFLALPTEAVDRMAEAARRCFLTRFEVSIAADAILAAFEDVRKSWPSDRAGKRRSGRVRWTR
jgi:glycosyltransferase involved in cell wall biosynthesis